MRLCLLGNFSVSFTTESHWALAFEANGVEVIRLQEGEVPFPEVARICGAEEVDLMMWVTTLALGNESTFNGQIEMLAKLRKVGVPTISVHLDRWHGLDRQDRLTHPYFRTDLVFTADGGHDSYWRQHGIEHHWLPPAISTSEAIPGQMRHLYKQDIIFVGSWRDYHKEHPHRTQLVGWLKETYEDRVTLWPKHRRGQAIRGRELRDLYASVKVIIGDSCLAPARDGKPIKKYLSDRIPETLGRGGYLLHPEIEGVTDGSLYKSGYHLDTWAMQDWAALQAKIDYALRHPEYRQRVATQGREHVLATATYEIRVTEILAELQKRELIK